MPDSPESSARNEIDPPTPEDAMNAWYALYNGRSDHPRVSVWMPSSLPHGRLQTHNYSGDPHGRESLPEGRTVAYVTVGGIEFGGWLDEIELMFRAVDEQIQRLRYVETSMRSAQSTSITQDGG